MRSLERQLATKFNVDNDYKEDLGKKKNSPGAVFEGQFCKAAYFVAEIVNIVKSFDVELYSHFSR